MNAVLNTTVQSSPEAIISALPTLAQWSLSAKGEYPQGTILFDIWDNSLNVVENSGLSFGEAVYESGKFYLGKGGASNPRALETLRYAQAYAESLRS